MGSSKTGLARRMADFAAHRARDTEGHLRRVHLVEAAVLQHYPDTQHRVSGQWAYAQSVLDALPHGGDELPRYRPAFDVVDELEAGPVFQRLDPQPDMTELAVAACLAHEPSLGPRRDGYRLPVRHTRPARVGLDLELPFHTVHQYLEMKLTHP